MTVSGIGKKWGWELERGGSPALTSTSSLTVVGSRRRMFKVLRNSECPVGLSQKEYVCISVKEIWRNFDGPPIEKKGRYGMFWN